jgi:hypothetical protein
MFAHGFCPAARKVRITTGHTVNYELNLPIDPRVLTEFGDRMFENPVLVEPLSNPKA